MFTRIREIKGFTVMDLVIGIAIIGILAAVAFPSRGLLWFVP